ncbi:MAG: TrkH family potassium uptake protein [Deltaproteobacteria bacterium]
MFRQLLSRLSPPHQLILSFASIILIGTALLMLPLSTVKGSIHPIDALFTATSAVCVTGLTVLDTGKDFSLFGQMVILGLIQCGGIGIITFSLFFMSIFRKSLPFYGRKTAEETFSQKGAEGFYPLLKSVIIFTVSIEAIGVLLLCLRFIPLHSVTGGLYYSIFHSISAFCNAGFSLFSNNLMDYKGDYLVNLVITGLIIMGGIGFVVLHELRAGIFSRKARISLHSKLVLMVTGILLFGGMVVFMLLEWNNTLAGLPIQTKLLASWFQSVTARTAGFNTLDYGMMTGATLFFTILLMFIGASPGSTGGGIKTSTIGVFIALAISRYRGREDVSLFNRAIPKDVVFKAFSVGLISGLLIVTFVIFILAVELGATPHQESRGIFLNLLFEAMSAFGTVGLSTGITPILSYPTKLLLILLMFAGRLGPLTIAIAFTKKEARGRFRHPEENVIIG